MKTDSDKVTSKVVTITPELAEKWLTHNTHNRPVRDRHADMLAGAIKRGEWKMNADPIRFAKDGTLLDGQHRLWAVVMADQSIESMVVRGLDYDAQMTMDYGARRGLRDHLRLQGYANATTLASIINMKWKIDNNAVRRNVLPTIQQALAVFDEHPDLVEGVRMIGKWKSRLPGASAAVGVLYYEFAMRDSDAAEAYFESVIEGVGLERGSPLAALRRQLETTKLGTVMQMALMIKAWNAYLEGREVTTIMWRPVGRSAEAFPKIEG